MLEVFGQGSKSPVARSAGRFAGKVALVTGGASGIGLAAARVFLREGARVVLADRDEKAALEAASALLEKSPSGESREDPQAQSAVAVSACDVSCESDVARAVALACERFGGLDVIVNNAGLMIFKPLEQHTAEDWRRVLDVDLLGAFFFTREAFRCMRPGGAIVNVSSVHAVETTPNVAAYAAAKAALVALTHSASIEGRPKGLRVNAILPGAVDTPMLWNNPNIKSGLEVIHKSDVGKPEDVAEAIAFLASDAAAFVNGTALSVDGGRLSRL